LIPLALQEFHVGEHRSMRYFSAHLGGQVVNGSSNTGAKDRVPWHKENTMLTKFAAALIATSLVAGSALAAQPLGDSGSAPANQTAQTASLARTSATGTVTAHKAVKTAKSRHTRKHIARGKSRKMLHARHNTPANAHQAAVGKNSKRS
jgi:hypothetical protein